ncbi:MAG: putative secreted protein [Streptomyces oryziradicis]|nr:putative secreted protein [Actinacidiphila oryziradicis]
MVQAWYRGGVSVWDFTDSAHPQEIGFFERGPVSADTFTAGDSWSANYYNGYIYSNDVREGFDVLKISDRRTDSAKRVRLAELNVRAGPATADRHGTAALRREAPRPAERP